MARRKFNKAKINTKLMIDVIGASLIVQKAPALIDSIFTLPESLKAFAGAGAGFVVGSLLKRPDLANASLALGVVDFVSPLVDSIIGGTSSTTIPASSSVLVPIKNTGGASGLVNTGVPVPADMEGAMADYIRLNDYISNPGVKMDFSGYANSY